jgi:hypothetical protein
VGPNCNDSCNEGSDNCSGNDQSGTACNDNLFCNGSDSCNGGSCSSHTGDPCPGPNGNTDCTETCDENNNNCNGYDGDGAFCDNGGDPDSCGDNNMGCTIGNPCSSAVCQ